MAASTSLSPNFCEIRLRDPIPAHHGRRKSPKGNMVRQIDLVVSDFSNSLHRTPEALKQKNSGQSC